MELTNKMGSIAICAREFGKRLETYTEQQKACDDRWIRYKNSAEIG